MEATIPTREYIIENWVRLDKEAAAKGGKPVGRSGLCRALGISLHWIQKLFAGEHLTEIKRQHGIRLSPQEDHLSQDQLFERLDEVVTNNKGIPAWNLLIHKTGISEKTWKKGLGGRAGCPKGEVYKRYAELLKAIKPESPNLEYFTHGLQPFQESEKPFEVNKSLRSGKNRTPIYQKTEGRVYGPKLDFRNMTHAPTSEQGVIFLFGMVSKDLGFDSIECLGPDFPDCEAKRRVGRGQETQRVQIEFELKSSHFKDHGHPLDRRCVIVCWENNWKDCPLEVIELKKEIKELRNKAEDRP
jgi:hypothetical protein